MTLRDRIHDALHEHRLQLLRDQKDPNKKKGSVLVMLCCLYYAIAIFKALRGK